jgi:hypothetical protein
LAGGTEERLQRIGRLDGGESDRRDKQAGVVVDEVQDLDLGVLGQVPVGGVGLPAFVGQAGLEADEGGAAACEAVG